MEYQVPKFIDAEPKIFGPLTFQNIITIMIVGTTLALLYFTLNNIQFIAIALPVTIATLVLMFVHVHGRPMMTYLKALSSFTTKSQIYLWKRDGLDKEGAEHILHIVTEHTASSLPTDTEAADAAPQSESQIMKSKVQEIASQLDESFASENS